MEFLLSYISHGLTDHFSYVLSYNCALFSEVADEEPEPVDLGGSNVYIICRLSHDKVLFLLGRWAKIFQVFFDILESDEGNYLRLNYFF